MKYLGLWLALLLSVPAGAQTNKAFLNAMRQLRSFASQDSLRVQASVNRWWEARKKGNQVPLLSNDSAVFLYRGTASSVAWAGDFNGWGSKPAPAKGTRIRNTDIWIAAFAFPPTARFDYKVILNGKDWILDPVNPHQQYSGVGGGTPNSELRMPAWRADACQQENPSLLQTCLETEFVLSSKYLGYEISYSIYTPLKVDSSTPLPTLYVTDGNEYSNLRLGNIQTVLDNLTEARTIRPLRLVLINAFDPEKPEINRRMTELSLNEDYLRFVTEELIPSVEGNQPIERVDRGILGTSLGGLTAAFFGFRRPDLFGLVGIQSPAFWYKPDIFALAEASGTPPLRIFMSTGTYHDTATEAQKMKEILLRHGHSLTYVEVPEGHSWGNWRNLLDDLLVALYAPK